MITKNDELIGTVSGLGANGEGVIKVSGKAVFVPFTLPGEKIKFKVLKVTSKCIYGKLLEVLTPSEIRVRTKCPIFGKCGGCQLQHVRYSNQLKIKEEMVATTMKKVANLSVNVKSTIKCDEPFRYRNKLQLPVADSDYGAVIGFYAENSHRVVQVSDCLINPPWTASVISAFKKFIIEYNIKGYNEVTNSGELREITVKEVKGNLIITAVVPTFDLREKEKLVEILQNELKYNFSLFLNINDKPTNAIYGEKFILVYGAPNYTSEMLGIKYKIGVQSFMQVNNSVCAKLYSTVREIVNADEETVVIDAYSGAGLMTALLAKGAKKAIGVEIVQEAVQCANELAKMNSLDDKITNYVGKCEDILPNLIANEKKNNSKVCVVLDPPRKGCDLSVINALIDCNIDKIVYVSCKPSTLARDLGLLVGTLKEENGEIKRVENPEYRYEITYIRPFDMFAQTKHVETLVCLTRK